MPQRHTVPLLQRLLINHCDDASESDGTTFHYYNMTRLCSRKLLPLPMATFTDGSWVTGCGKKKTLFEMVMSF